MVIIRKRIISGILIILLTSLSVLSTGASENTVVCDSESNTIYTVSFDNDSVSISSDDYQVVFENTNHLFACDVHDGIFRFLGYNYKDNGKEQTVIYSYDIRSGDSNHIAVNTEASFSPHNFAVSRNDECFFVSRLDNKTLCTLSKDGTLKATTLKGTINQIICHDGITVNVITSDGLYILKNSEVQKISNTPPKDPLVYTDSETLMAYDGKHHHFFDGVLAPIQEETPAAHSPQINFDDSFCIVPQGVTIAKLRDSLGAHKDSFSIFDKDSKEIASGHLGTGMEIRYKSKTFTAVIYGELTSEGNINSRDLKLMMKFITGEEVPDKAQTKAADINRDGNISVKDLLLLSKMY